MVSAGRCLSTRSASAASLQPLLFLLTPQGEEIVVQHWEGKIDYFKVLKAVAFKALIGISLSFHPVLLALERPEQLSQAE